MVFNSFDELVENRKEWIQSSKKNKFDLDSTLSGIYNDPSHFIYEILQNAEDAGAKKVTFELTQEQLKITHDGKDFNFEDVDGITGIGISTKKDDINAIGKFGVGFKSVFAITKTPAIYSGQYHFQIVNFVVPTLIDSKTIEQTQIVLPFDHPTRSRQEVYELIRQKLEKIDLKTLLFLKNITEIKWQTTNAQGHCYKESQKIENYKNTQRISIISKTGDEEAFEKYLVIHRPIQIEDNTLKVEVAYRIERDESGDERIIKEKDSKLIVFFPTEKVTYLNFLIQGPYRTTPNRENIPLDDEQNQHILAETSILVADSISIIKGMGLLDVVFLEVLPIDSDHSDEIYSSIYNTVKEKLLSEEKLLPTAEGSFTTCQNSVLARGKGLTELLDRDDINVLFGKDHWLDTNITSNRTPNLRSYLIRELRVGEIGFENFGENITVNFMERKSDDWVIEFYRRLLGQRGLWDRWDRYHDHSLQPGIPMRLKDGTLLRRKPIIRLSDGSHIEPDNSDNKIQVYLPSDTKSAYKTVKQELADDEYSLKFLTELGLSKPDIFAEIKEFILPKYQNAEVDIVLEEYCEDIEKLLIAFNVKSPPKLKFHSKVEKKNNRRRGGPLDEKEKLIADLQNLFIVFASRPSTGEKAFRKPGEVHFETEELQEYFKGYSSAWFISNELYPKDTNNELHDFLEAIGCNNQPQRIEIQSTLSEEEKLKLRQGYSSKGRIKKEEYLKDYTLEGLDNFLHQEKLTKKRSVILWNFLSKLKFQAFRGEYCWWYHNGYTVTFEAEFVKVLKSHAWLIDKDERFVKPNQITMLDLHDDYSREDNALERIFDFQSDEIQRIESKLNVKVVSPKEYKEFEQWKAAEQAKKEEAQKKKKKEWAPEVDPNSIIPIAEEYEPPINDTQDLRGQESHPVKTTHTEQEQDIEDSDKKSDKDKKAIGKCGEQYVQNYLNEQYSDKDGIEIQWLNQNGDRGIGYDFVVVSDGVEIEYIEVKSKTDAKSQFLNVTGTQCNASDGIGHFLNLNLEF